MCKTTHKKSFQRLLKTAKKMLAVYGGKSLVLDSVEVTLVHK